MTGLIDLDVLQLTDLTHFAFGRLKDLPGRRQPRYGLALAGGGIVGGMFEVGAMAALEEGLGGGPCRFDIYVGCSSGSVLASLLASGMRASERYDILEQDLDDPLNFRRGVLFASETLRVACGRFGQSVWAIGKCALRGGRCLPDMLAHAERELPAV